MKTLRENDSGLSARTRRCKFGNWVYTRIEKDVDHTYKQPIGLGRAVKLSTNVLVSLMIVVSLEDDFTPVVHMQPFTKFNSRD